MIREGNSWGSNHHKIGKQQILEVPYTNEVEIYQVVRKDHISPYHQSLDAGSACRVS